MSNITPIAPAQGEPDRMLDFSDFKIEMNDDGTSISTTLLVDDAKLQVGPITMQIDVELHEIPATNRDGLEEWLMDLLHKIFTPKSAYVGRQIAYSHPCDLSLVTGSPVSETNEGASADPV